MKTLVKSFSIFFLLVFAFGTNEAQVRVDYDKSVDFTTYKSYRFRGWEKDSDQILNDFDKERIINAFKSELEARGFTSDEENADVGITLFVVVAARTSRTAYTNYNRGYGYGGYGRSWGYGSGMGTSTTTYSERDYREGTIVIDFYDEETKGLVFQGVLQTEVQEKAKKREKTIPKNIAKLMTKYPVKKLKK